ncbi:unnamed protein product [Effrenium voratum]|uniref:Calcineurin-like phosphoesterase domain-containing protein n=2 Tax=Effrenium voratum TaxID=2562239 RepID=A0AA36MLG7_9DINO|nr:unnamed protein product [Effrenium voratum]
MEGPDSEWREGIVAGMVQTRDKADEVILPLRNLRPNQWYCVQVDARYPYVGKRAFSDSKAISPPFLTPFPARGPLQPMPVRLDLDEEVEEPSEDSEDFCWAARPWVSLRVEKGFLPEQYMLQYKEAVPGGEEMGKEHFHGWEEPMVVERFNKDKRNSEHWDTVRVGLPAGAPEIVVLRLMTVSPKTAAPLQWSIASQPVVSRIALPRLAEGQDGAVMRFLPSVGALHLHLRFFLQPGPVLKEGHLPQTQRTATTNESVGHRHVAQYQLRIRMKGETQKELPVGVKGPRRFIELPAAALPPAHAVGTQPSLGEPETWEEAWVAGLLGCFGHRYELQVDLSDQLRELLMGHDQLEASLRVGTEYRWSCWTPWSAPQPLPLPLPAPLRSSVATAEALGPTAIKVCWPPFDRVPGINSLEYVVRAEPQLGEGAASCAETVICFQHEPRKADGQIVGSNQFQRLLDAKEDSHLARLAACFQDIRDLEGDEEKDTKLQVELNGLLPWTRYLISVSARYPAGAGIYPRSQLEGRPQSEGMGLLVGHKLTTQVVTPGGENCPAPPRQVGWQDIPQEKQQEDGSKFLETGKRAAFLSIEDRSEYVLEYRACAPTWAHYDPEVGVALRDFQGSWPRNEDEEGSWKRVPMVQRLGRGVGEAYSTKSFGGFTAPAEATMKRFAVARLVPGPCWSGNVPYGFLASGLSLGSGFSVSRAESRIQDIGFLTDLEGDLDTFERYVASKDSVLRRSPGGPLRLGDSKAFVFGGDLFDRGKGDLRLARELLKLKETYPERVFFLLGNRDINKMRLSAELSEEALGRKPSEAFVAWWDPKAPTLAKFLETKRQPNTAVSRLKWMLRHTLGAPGAFNYRREELAILRNAEVDQISDEEVVASFQRSVLHPQGEVRSYLRAAQIGLILGDTLFVHGAVDEEALGFVPSPETRYQAHSKEELLALPKAQTGLALKAWIEALNAFAAEQVEDWCRQPFWRTEDGVLRRGGEALMAYQCRPAVALSTVVVTCYVDGKNMPSRKAIEQDKIERKCTDPLSPKVREYLAQGQVRRVVVGHKPSGEAPAVLRTDADGLGPYEVISMDTNYASTQDHSQRGGSWCELRVALLPGGGSQARLRGRRPDSGDAFDFRLPGIGGDSGDGDEFVGHQTADGWWVRLKLASGQYLLSRGEGRIAEYRTVEAKEIAAQVLELPAL